MMQSSHGQAVVKEPLWWSQVLREPLPEPVAPPLTGRHTVDVAIVGGGYVGLWTAIELKRRDPSARVMLLEQSACGAGASGRNNGFVIPWWSKIGTLVKLLGEGEALRLGHAAERAIDDIYNFSCTHTLDIGFRRGGWIWAATARAQLGAWDSTMSVCHRLGVHPFHRLSQAELRARVASPRHLGGVIDPNAATLHSGRLVRGLRRVAIAQGVDIHEKTRVVRIEAGEPLVLVTDGGKVIADYAVLAINAWAAGWPGLRRQIVGIAADGIATEPIPDRLREMGWTGGEGVTDSRQMIRVYRTDEDGRISFGYGGRGVAFGARIGRRFRVSPRHLPATLDQFRRIFPMLSDVAIHHNWSAVIDRSPTGLPLFGRLGKAENVLYGVGWSGIGVAPSLLGGRILASMALGSNDEWSSCGLVRLTQGAFPREPIRFLGAQIVRRAVERKENADDAGKRPTKLTEALTRFAPANITPTNAAQQTKMRS